MTQQAAGPSRHEGDPVKGSRFIVDVAPVSTEAEARDLLAQIAAEFADASHHCSAWRLAHPAIERASDDGEPSGSAGRPILAQLAGRDLVDTAVVVTRYFGGTKLGVGGLVRAYGGAAGQALDAVTFLPWTEMCELSFSHGYAGTDAIERLVAAHGGTIEDRAFAASVALSIRIPVDAVDAFSATVANVTSGAAVVTRENDSVPE